MNLETAIETPRTMLAKSSTCGRIKMVQKHFNFPRKINSLGCKISTDKAKTNQES